MRGSVFMSLFFAVAVSMSPTPAMTLPAQLEGSWQQIQSTAGACPACQLSIDQSGSSLIATANNGWSASVVARERGDVIEAAGPVPGDQAWPARWRDSGSTSASS